MTDVDLIVIGSLFLVCLLVVAIAYAWRNPPEDPR